MCKEHRSVLVPIPDFIKADRLCWRAGHPEIFTEANGEYGIDSEGRECFAIDACLVPALTVLWNAKIKTTGSCCGHGSGSGVIGLVTYYDRNGKHIDEAPPYNLVAVVEQRRHENQAYDRGRNDAYVAAGREDLWLAEQDELRRGKCT